MRNYKLFCEAEMKVHDRLTVPYRKLNYLYPGLGHYALSRGLTPKEAIAECQNLIFIPDVPEEWRP
jgi:hypothetical protein